MWQASQLACPEPTMPKRAGVSQYLPSSSPPMYLCVRAGTGGMAYELNAATSCCALSAENGWAVNKNTRTPILALECRARSRGGCECSGLPPLGYCRVCGGCMFYLSLSPWGYLEGLGPITRERQKNKLAQVQNDGIVIWHRYKPHRWGEKLFTPPAGRRLLYPTVPALCQAKPRRTPAREGCDPGTDLTFEPSGIPNEQSLAPHRARALPNRWGILAYYLRTHNAPLSTFKVQIAMEYCS